MLVLPWTGASVSEEDWHWAVGIWEGEGGVGVYSKTRTKLHITSTDRDMIEECARCFDIGLVVAKGSVSPRHKDIWRLEENRRSVVADWCRVAIPYIRTERKRQQARDTLSALDRLGPARKTGNRYLMFYGRSGVAKESEILGLTSGKQSAIGDC